MKPLKLTEYFAKLIMPPEIDNEPRRLLIPFAGVGSEMLGALLAGWGSVTGIEREHEYVSQARERLTWWSQFKTYEQASSAYNGDKKQMQREQQTGQLPLFAA